MSEVAKEKDFILILMISIKRLTFFLNGISFLRTIVFLNSVFLVYHTPSYAVEIKTKHPDTFTENYTENSIENFKAEGKVAYNRQGKGGNATIIWQQTGEKYHIRLIGALGAGSIEIFGRPGFVGLVQSNGESCKATDPESLLRQQLGWTIPVSPLQFWLQGKPVPKSRYGAGEPSQLHFNEEGRIASFHQAGWSVRYDKYLVQQGMVLPSVIILQNGPIRLKFIFKRWMLN